MKNSATIDQDEINHFAKDSNNWWDEDGAFKPLHRLNPIRIEYIQEQITSHYNSDNIEDLSIIDIGCGGGLASEALAEMGAKVTGIDADNNAIEAAIDHAHKSDLDIKYLCGDASDIKQKYDVVMALEIIEHVSDIPAFIEICAKLLKPKGLLIISTLNRTPKSYALGIIAAEYIMRWVPRGTHSWKKFVKPSEVAKHCSKHNLTPQNITGLIYNPLQNEFQLSETDLDVNYLMSLKLSS